MFSVIFEVHPKPEQWDGYLGYAKLLRPELVKVEGFVDNIRYASLTRAGWILSLSGWVDEKALVRWRTVAMHHDVQQKGRDEILLDYHLRVGQITVDSRLPSGLELKEQRLDETVTGEGTAVTLVDAKQSPEWVKENGAEKVAEWLGLDKEAEGLVGWDVFDAVLAPGEIMLLLSWKGAADAERFEATHSTPEEARVRRVRVVRDYGKYDRREAPQCYVEAKPNPVDH